MELDSEKNPASLIQYQTSPQFTFISLCKWDLRITGIKYHSTIVWNFIVLKQESAFILLKLCKKMFIRIVELSILVHLIK